MSMRKSQRSRRLSSAVLIFAEDLNLKQNDYNLKGISS